MEYGRLAGEELEIIRHLFYYFYCFFFPGIRQASGRGAGDYQAPFLLPLLFLFVFIFVPSKVSALTEAP